MADLVLPCFDTLLLRSCSLAELLRKPVKCYIRLDFDTFDSAIIERRQTSLKSALTALKTPWPGSMILPATPDFLRLAYCRLLWR